MNRRGFDKMIHPRQLQLRMCIGFDYQGLQNDSSVTIDFETGRITNYHTNDNQISTSIREYVASDEELKELYGFFTMDSIKKFEAMQESELRQYGTGYYDVAFLRYIMISEEGIVADGRRSYIYSNDPIEMVMMWMHRVLPFDMEL